MASKKSRSSRSSRSTRRSRGARHGDAVDRLLSGHGPYYYENDRELLVLLDVARPHGRRKLPQPQDSVVYDKTYAAMDDRGFIRWVQVHPAHTSLADDHYELTDKGREAVAAYKAFVKRIAGR